MKITKRPETSTVFRAAHALTVPMGVTTADAVAAYAGKQRLAAANGAVTTPGSPAWRPLA